MATGQSKASEPGVMERRTTIKDYDGDSGNPIVTTHSFEDDELSGLRDPAPEVAEGEEVDLGYVTGDGDKPTVTVDKAIADMVKGDADAPADPDAKSAKKSAPASGSSSGSSSS